MFAGGVFDDINENASNLREIVDQYGGIIIDDFGVIKLPNRIYFNSVPQVVEVNGGGTLYLGTSENVGSISGYGSLIKLGSDTLTLSNPYYNYAHSHDVIADAMLTDDGQLRFTFSPDELEGASRTYQILSQPDQGISAWSMAVLFSIPRIRTTCQRKKSISNTAKLKAME